MQGETAVEGKGRPLVCRAGVCQPCVKEDPGGLGEQGNGWGWREAVRA